MRNNTFVWLPTNTDIVWTVVDRMLTEAEESGHNLNELKSIRILRAGKIEKEDEGYVTNEYLVRENRYAVVMEFYGSDAAEEATKSVKQ